MVTTLLLLLACGSGAPQPGPPIDWAEFEPRALSAADGDVQGLATPGPQDQWTYGGVFDGSGYVHGRWVSHPPIEFVVELLGRDLVDQCVRKMKNKREPASWCVLRIPPCEQIRIARDGSVEYEVEAVSCGRDVVPEDARERLRWKYIE